VSGSEGEALRRFLERRTGFALPDERWAWLAPRFLDRLEGRGFTRVADYVRYLEEDPLGRAEVDEVIDALTVRKTEFFRNPAVFQALEDLVLPRLLARPAGASVWSAGCATGEEPYSIAMVARSLARDAGEPAAGESSCYILGTDIVGDALATAREGSYPRAALEGVPERFRRFVHVVGGRAWVREEVRAAVELTMHNLIHDDLPLPASGAWDVISCRNVLIYFGLEQSREVVGRLTEVLAPGGVLFLGHAEVLTGIERDFEVVFHGDAFFYRKRAGRPASRRHRRPGTRRLLRPASRRLERPAGRADRPPADAPTTPAPLSGAGRHDVPTTSRPLPGGGRHDAPTDAFARRRTSGRGVTPTRAFPRGDTSRFPPKAGGDDETRAEGRPGERRRDALLQAQLRLDGGDEDGAVRILQASVEQDPRWAAPRVLLAEAHLRAGELARAHHQLETATAADPLDRRAHRLLGELKARQGDAAAAELSLRRALYLEPDDVLARAALAEVYRAAGKTTRAQREARNTLRSLRDLDPQRRRTLLAGEDEAAVRERCEGLLG